MQRPNLATMLLAKRRRSLSRRRNPLIVRPFKLMVQVKLSITEKSEYKSPAESQALTTTSTGSSRTFYDCPHSSISGQGSWLQVWSQL
jgi:hypothetical protein